MNRQTLINKLRLLFAKQEKLYSFWYGLLGFYPNNLSLYDQALTHRSSAQGNNERLEYLGDAVLGLVVADILCRLYPSASEGFLTRARAKMVSREHLNKVAYRLQLHQYLKVGANIRENADNLYGNALEALVGAIYADAGYQAAERFIRQHVITKDEQQLKHFLEKEIDFKSRLLEWGQRRHKKVEFVFLRDNYEAAHDRHAFLFEVQIDGEAVAQAAGKTKLEAQQIVAKKTLRLLK